MQNIKNKEGESIKETRGGLRRREKSNSASMVELWAEKERKKEEEAKKRIRQKEEECQEIFKRNKLVERSSRNRIERENEAEDGAKELITVLKKIRNELKQEMAELRKKVREMKEEWKTRGKDLEQRMDTMEKKMKETERTIIDRHKEEEEERKVRITNRVAE